MTAADTFTPAEELNAGAASSAMALVQDLLASPAEGIADPEGIRDQYAAYVEDWVGFGESDLGVDEVDPATATVDELIEVQTAGCDDIDGDAHAEQFEEFMAGLDGSK